MKKSLVSVTSPYFPLREKPLLNLRASLVPGFIQNIKALGLVVSDKERFFFMFSLSI